MKHAWNQSTVFPCCQSTAVFHTHFLSFPNEAPALSKSNKSPLSAPTSILSSCNQVWPELSWTQLCWLAETDVFTKGYKKKTHITPLTHMEKTCKIVVSYVLMLFYCIELFEFAWQTTSLTNEITWWFLICHVPKCPSSMQQTNLLQVGKKMRHT